MPFAPDVTCHIFKELLIKFYSPNRISPVNPFIRLNSSPGIILPILLFVQRAQTGRGNFIFDINDHLGVKPTVSIVTIATRQ